MVLIPDLKVYNQIRTTVMVTVCQNWIPNSSNKIICKTLATKYSLKLDPTSLEIKKNEAPVLYEKLPNRSSK
jgi:hypothetical protein